MKYKARKLEVCVLEEEFEKTKELIWKVLTEEEIHFCIVEKGGVKQKEVMVE